MSDVDKTPEVESLLTMMSDFIDKSIVGEGTIELDDIVGEFIKKYAKFAHKLTNAIGPTEALKIAGEDEMSMVLNDKIQHMIRLSEKGLVTIQPGTTVREYIFHPVVRYVSEETVNDTTEFWGDDSSPNSALQSLLISLAAAQILGGVKFWIDPAVLDPDDYALVHPLSSTKH